MSRLTWWVRNPRDKSQRLLLVRATEVNNRNTYVFKIGTNLCYKLGQFCFITN